MTFPIAQLMNLLLSTLLLSALVSNAATYYVRTDGSDSNTGLANTPGDAWLTLDKAMNTVAAGDNVQVGSGTFSATSNTDTPGSAGNLIRFTGSGPTTIVSGRMTIDQAYYWIEALKFTTTYLLLTTSNASNCTITNCTFTAASNGINMTGAESPYNGATGPSTNLITGCEFYQLTSDGMVVINGHHNTITNSYFHDSQDWDALRVFGSNHTIVSNRFVNISTTGAGNHVDVIQSFKSADSIITTNIVFERNLIKDCTGQFGNLENDIANTVLGYWHFRNNVFWNSRIQLNCYIPYVTVENNSIYYANYLTGFRFTTSGDKGNGDNATILNNIFSRCAGGENAGAYEVNIALTNVTKNYNFISDLDNSSKTGYSEANGINGGFPGYNNATVGDFTLASSSACIAAGFNLSSVFTNDKDGLTRTIPWDIGAYKYTSSTQPAAPTNLRLTP